MTACREGCCDEPSVSIWDTARVVAEQWRQGLTLNTKSITISSSKPRIFVMASLTHGFSTSSFTLDKSTYGWQVAEKDQVRMNECHQTIV